MNTPTVTIGLPVYNGQDYLVEAIDAILGQTYIDFELIISDNDSTDQTREICQRYALNDKRIRYVCQDRNIGAIANFNALVYLARGKYFKWAAHDDVMDAQYVECMVDCLDARPNIAWVYCNSDMIDETGKSFRKILSSADDEIVLIDGKRQWIGHPRSHAESESSASRFQGVILGSNWCVDSYGLFRKSILHKSRLLLPVYGSEKILMAEIALLGKCAYLPDLMFFQRIHENASGNLKSQQAQQIFSGDRKKSKFVNTRLYILWAHIGSVYRAPIPIIEKIRAYYAVVQYILQMKKWSMVLRMKLSGAGVGGAAARLLKIAERQGSDSNHDSS